MPFLITAYDHPNKEIEREEVRQAHRDYLASFGKRLLSSGALLDEAGENIVGGATLFDTDNREEALLFEAEDPYAKAGIRSKVRVTQWRLRWWNGEFDANGHKPSRK